MNINVWFVAAGSIIWEGGALAFPLVGKSYFSETSTNILAI